VLFERLELLSPIVIKDVKRRAAESMKGIAVIVRDGNVSEYFTGIGVEDVPALLRGRLSVGV
jgi:hypothetical protein